THASDRRNFAVRVEFMATISSGVSEESSRRSRCAVLAEDRRFTGLQMVCYAPLLGGLARQWATAEDMSHGFFVPLAAGIVTWRCRAEIATSPASPNYWGPALAAWGPRKWSLALRRHSYSPRGLHFSVLLPVRCSSSAERASSRSWPFLFSGPRSCFRYPPSSMHALRYRCCCSSRALLKHSESRSTSPARRQCPGNGEPEALGRRGL